MVNLSALLSDAVASEDGRKRCLAMCKDAKDVADSCVFLSMSLHKYANDSSISAAPLASDSPDERFIYEQLYAAWAAINEARTRLTNLHLAALKEARRD